MVAIIMTGEVIAMGDYTSEDYPNTLIIEITQEEFEVISSYQYPRYENGVFFDGYILNFMNTEKFQNINRMEFGKIVYSEYVGHVYINKLFGSISNEVYLEKKQLFNPVRDELLAGDFENAKIQLINLGENVIGQELYNKFMGKIDALITEHYITYGIETPLQVQQRKSNRL